MWRLISLCILFLSKLCFGRIHQLEITNDLRKYIALTTFGFYKGGVLDVKLINFTANPLNESDVFGFTLDRTLTDAMSPYLDRHQERCLLKESFQEERDVAAIYFIMDLKNRTLRVKCSSDFKQVHIYKNAEYAPLSSSKKNLIPRSMLINLRKKRSVEKSTNTSKLVENYCDQLDLPITVQKRNGINFYNTSFFMSVVSDAEEGLYNLYFYNCPNYEANREVSLDFTMEIKEDNDGNYLSADEMPLPALYCTMAVLFFLSGAFWVFLLRQSRHPVFKIHYLMAVLVFLKGLSLGFHGVNYHYIETLGVHLATWAVLYYVAHLLKGALLFVTLVLIGTGWTFIKHVLAPRDKRLFMAVIPLQVLANVAEIILAESEEGAREHHTWREVFILVDLLCCGCILFPVVWSIRHLQEASQTDGKAAINLKKLKLFRHFYIMIVCYIYFTRIIVFLLQITVPFQYGWLDEMFREMATYVFFVLTGYKFRPAAHNPYFILNQDDDDEDEIVLTESGIMEGVNRVNTHKPVSAHSSTLVEITEQENEALLAQREGSHDYD